MERSDKMKATSPRKESSSPRTREGSILSLSRIILLGDGFDQLTEDRVEGVEQSDPSIVVRDGKTDHKTVQGIGAPVGAKGRAGGQIEHSTHRAERTSAINGVKHPACKGKRRLLRK